MMNEKNQKKNKRNGLHSMRGELTALVMGIICCAVLALFLLTYFGLEPFYYRQKIRQLETTFEAINELDASSEDFTDRLLYETLPDNIRVTVTDEDFVAFASNGRDEDWNTARLFGYFSGFGQDNDNLEVFEENDTWTLQESTDRKTGTRYLELWGQLRWGGYCLLQVPCQSITSAAHLTAVFYIFIGFGVVIAASILTWILIRAYTKPIMELTRITRRMAGLDFNARYSGRQTNEIGELGRAFNKMSDELELTIAELKSANVELMKDNEEKTQIDEVRKEFLNNVSHELKTPIALIQGYAEGLRDNVAGDEESRAFYCDVIIDEASKMNTMVKKLLTLNQLEFGNDPVVMDRFNLTDLIRGVITGMQIMIDEAGAEVSFPVASPCYVWGDAFKIEEVVTNYLSNAVHHVSGEKRIEITLSYSGSGRVTTTVFNTGTPIPEKDLPRVFEKFYKVDKARTREYGGSGIGLSIVRAIMDGHHESCGVTNYENGVAFWFTLDSRPKGYGTEE